ncbi:hypothetical protein, conserved [Babesia ovata]|uniref:C3H1-type domain-containing protein n=1 Tax=Babesia ovata TaxID=189622 RepID=A0A2H6KJC2_9APIC|nr:uncharacterized protein BOVATA_045880 [Babesia ovata]GBE63095.1 hypothetical protein, conserved [Babesia ovata]
MSFLHGVLHNIQGHLGQHRNKIDDAISLLERNKHRGKDGFNEAIVKVVEGVKQYNEGVDVSHNNVKTEIELLKKHLRTLKESVNSYSDHQHVNEIDKNVEHCLHQAYQYKEGIEGQKTNNIKDMQYDLANKVNKATEIIDYQRALLSAIWKKLKTDRDEVVALVEKQMEGAKNSIIKITVEQIRAFVGRLNVEIDKLRRKIWDVDAALQSHVKAMETWINKAHEAVEAAMRKVAAILKEVDKSPSNAENKNNLEKAIGSLQEKAFKLFRAYEAAEKCLPDLIRAVMTAVNGLDGKIRQDLNALKRQIDSTIEAYVKEAQEELATLKEKVERNKGDQNKDNLEYNWLVLKTDMVWLIDKIKGKKSGSPDYEGLQGINEKVKDYVKRFTENDMFEGIVKQWITKILEQDVLVREYIASYVSLSQEEAFVEDYVSVYNKEFKSEKIKEIADQIKLKLQQGVITEAKKKIDVVDSKIVKNVAKVYECITTFVEKLDVKLDKKQLPSQSRQEFVTSMADAIEEKVKKSVTSYRTNKNFLESAVKAILTALRSTASEAAEELKSFTCTEKLNIMANVNRAIQDATEIKQIIGNGIGNDNQPGSKITKALDTVKAKIDFLDSILSTDVLGGEIDKVIMPFVKTGKEWREKMKTYAGHIGEDDKLGNHVKGEIKNLQETALKTFDPLKITANTNKIQENVITFYEKLNAFCTAIVNAAANGGESVSGRLEELENVLISKLNPKIPGSLNNLHKQFDELQKKYLYPLFSETRKISTDATIQADAMIRTLERHVDTTLNGAKSTIQNDIKRRYVIFFKEQIEAFSKKVDEEFKGLPQQIVDDANKESKGFMKELYRLSNSHINRQLLKDARLYDLSFNTKQFFINLLQALIGKSEIMPVTYLSDLQNKLNTLFTELTKYDKNFVNQLDLLNTYLSSIRPASYATESNPLLDVLTKGLIGMHDELSKAYVSVYDSEPWDAAHENKYAKIYFTLLKTVCHDLIRLREHCDGDCKDKKICLLEMSDRKQIANPLGQWLDKRGFTVSNSPDKQNGELNKEKNTDAIKTLLDKTIPKSQDNLHLQQCISHKKDGFPVMDILDCLFDHLTQYNKASHLIIPQSPKSPSSVNDMLHWLSGLRYNSMRQPVVSAFNGLFSDAEKGLAVTAPHDVLRKIPNSTLRPNTLAGTLTVVCRQAEKTLIAIQGYGHSDGRYASDFSNNSRNLMYPTNPAACMDMLIDILCRLQQQLCFLYRQCCFMSNCSGWRDCHYGKHVAGSSWQCNDKQCANLNCKLSPNQNTKQSATQKADQKCDQHPTCGVKSPLQSFLEDGLQGFLPHSFKTPGCKLDCTMSNHRGIPCKTPMGFADIGMTASHTKDGAYLRDVLYDFCGDATKPLSKICTYFNCLLQRPPQNLGDMFSFYFNLLYKYDLQGHDHKRDAFVKAVEKAYFGHEYPKLQIRFLQLSQKHSARHDKGDMFSIIKCDDEDGNPAQTCGSYLSPITQHISGMFSAAYADKYLSWIVYLTETFYDLLKKLYDECNNKCGPKGSNCFTKCCVKDCPLTKEKPQPKDNHDSLCKSIVKCPAMLPTLCQYGFTFGSQYDISGMNGSPLKRTCNDFCNALAKLLGNNSVLIELRQQIDEFIWAIRESFSITLLALWSLSLLYLLHITVVRLDVLKIRSHLRTPSSHRIAAQSLLAAARVKALANVKYFSP